MNSNFFLLRRMTQKEPVRTTVSLFQATNLGFFLPQTFTMLSSQNLNRTCFSHICHLLSSHPIDLQNLPMPHHFLPSYKYFITFRSYFPNYKILSKKMCILSKPGVSRLNQSDVRLSYHSATTCCNFED